MSSNNGEGCMGCVVWTLILCGMLVVLGVVAKVAFRLALLGWEALS